MKKLALALATFAALAVATPASAQMYGGWWGGPAYGGWWGGPAYGRQRYTHYRVYRYHRPYVRSYGYGGWWGGGYGYRGWWGGY